jgi:hypothetical protein
VLVKQTLSLSKRAVIRKRHSLSGTVIDDVTVRANTSEKVKPKGRTEYENLDVTNCETHEIQPSCRNELHLKT